MNVRRSIAIAVLAAASLSQLCIAQEITVAAAADLQFAMQDIAARFEKETAKKVKLIYGSSGNLFQQIPNGAPFDMFFSANLDYAKRLEAAGLTEPGVRKGQDRNLGSEGVKNRSEFRHPGAP